MDSILHWVFVVLAVAGLTSMVLQLALSFLGFAGHGLVEMGDFAHDLPYDVPDDIGHDFGHHLPHEVNHDAGGHGPSWFFSMISLRSIIAFLAFFGLGGLSGMAAGLSAGASVLVALVFGAAAFVMVGLLMLGLQQLSEDGTIRIERAVGQTATVYLPIPAGGAGVGKVQIKLQGRLAEYPAHTAGPLRLEVGAKVMVTAVRDGRTLEVESLAEEAPQLASAGSAEA